MPNEDATMKRFEGFATVPSIRHRESLRSWSSSTYESDNCRLTVHSLRFKET